MISGENVKVPDEGCEKRRRVGRNTDDVEMTIVRTMIEWMLWLDSKLVEKRIEKGKVEKEKRIDGMAGEWINSIGRRKRVVDLLSTCFDLSR